MNSLANTNKEFHWLRAYNWSSNLHVEDISSKNLRTIALVKVGCMPKVFTVLEFMLWCYKHFNASKRIVYIGDNTFHPNSLNPLVFQRILRLLETNRKLKLAKEDDFITSDGIPKMLFHYFIDSLYGINMCSF